MFLLHLSRFSPDTQRAYQRAIGLFVASAPKNINHIRAEHIEQFILGLKCSASTRNFYLAALRSWFAWLETNYDVRNVARKVDRLPTLPPYQRILTHQEYEKVIAATSGYMRDCLVFLANSGLRASAFLSLIPENINGQFITIVGKGQKQRSIPINKNIKDILNRNPHLNFIKSRSRTWLWRLCRRAAKLANIPPFSPHSLRHYFATELHKNHVPIETISKLLGHSCTSVTESVYVHWQAEELVGITDCLD